MIVDDRGLGVERGRHRNRQLLGELDHLALGAGADDAAAGDDHRPFRRRSAHRAPPCDLLHVGLGTERRHAAVASAPPADRARLPPRSIWPRWLWTRRCTGPGAPEVATRNACRIRSGIRDDVIDLRVELGHRVELGDVVDFLIGVPVARLRRRAAGDRDRSARPP